MHIISVFLVFVSCTFMHVYDLLCNEISANRNLKPGGGSHVARSLI